MALPGKNRIERLMSRAQLAAFHGLGGMIGGLARATGADDAALAGFLARLLVHARRDDASIAAVTGAAGSSARLIESQASGTGAQEDVSALINFSSTWRNEWVIAKAAAIPNGARVLDAGAGECQYRQYFSHTNYAAQDFAGYKGTSEGVQEETWDYGKIDYVCDITAIPVPDGSFDVVLCTEVLEHVQDPIATVKELVRVLRPGGQLLLSAPLGCGLHQQPYHYYGGFTPFFYREFLTRFGMSVSEIKPLGGLLRHVSQECHRVGRVIAAHQGDDADKAILDLLMNLMPKALSRLDEKYFVEEFTVGYLVEAIKNPAGAAVAPAEPVANQ
jgi:2-polyprenyl-3-methyl-5-hydroxy-6-metoxy-1,4-benzoquinol methylase